MTPVNEIRVKFDHVTRRFRSQSRKNPGDEITAIQDINFSIHRGEVVSIIGPSGCGKSTLLGLASGLDQPTEGQVFVDGLKVEKPNSHVAFMLQKDMLLPWRTIRQNVELGQEIQGVPTQERAARAIELLRAAGYDLLSIRESAPGVPDEEVPIRRSGMCSLHARG